MATTKNLILPHSSTITIKNMVLDVTIDATSESMKSICETLGVGTIYLGIPPRLAGEVSNDDLPTIWTEEVTEFESNGEMCETIVNTFDDSEILAL